jgi:hypothetical protein
MESVVAAVASVPGGSAVGRQLLEPLTQQTELLRQAVEQQQRIQAQLVERAFAPVDAIFDLLENTGAMMREQAEALHQAAQGVERAAEVTRMQAELFEGATRAARLPSDAVRSVAGAGAAAPRRARAAKRK